VAPSSIIEVPAFQNILQYTAGFIFEKFAEQAPDFSSLFVLLPHSQVTQQFNKTLCYSLKPKLAAIIPPWTGTLKAWTRHFVENQHPDYQVIGEHSRQLLFIEALQQHPDLFKEENQWQVTQALLSLFDELSLNQQDLFTSPEKWRQQLQQAYGIEKQHQHLLNESSLVYTLWHAWKQQLSENKLYDETSDYISRLTNAATAINNQHYFICLGLSQYSKTEQDFIQNLVNNNQCHIIEFGKTIVTDGRNDDLHHTFFTFISETFKQSSQSEKQPSIKQRAQKYIENHSEHSATELPFSVYMAANEEQQIRAIDYFVRLNILNGKNNIAIISEDRKLSRRLRALLERANIQLQDKAGWSLATTQAATIIERWLECIEEDFSAYPLLDCLKSPFISITAAALGKEATDENFRKNIYRFEHDLIFHENISSNISQYKSILKERLKRLTHWPANSYDDIINTLDYIQKTAAPLSKYYSDFNLDKNNKKILLSDFLDALFASLEQLGVIQCYQDDEAGLVLLRTFEDLKQSIQYSNPALSWYDCRIWLGMALESQHFTPATNRTNVQLMTLEQASHLNFDCIIIAATESQHFPGSAKNNPFFNQAVRASLGLSTWEVQREKRHELFNRVLLSAPEILLTACDEEKGEEKPVSPWLELLVNFYQLTYSKKPDNTYLRQLLQSTGEVFNCDVNELPAQSTPPSPAIPQDLIPQRISASSYQRIINCPYQYFSADGLGLKALEELTDELKKSDYGERIHLILQTFHNGHKKYGKAFSHSITGTNRTQAELHLSELSEKIFLSDLENNVLHRSWLYRWKKHIPSYISWQMQHQIDWDIYLSEKILEVDLDDTLDDTLDNSLKIYGRIDRIDCKKENKTHAIIDYKTGKTARQEDVDTGENVQLSTYALLDNEASEVSYLSVDSTYQKVEMKSSLSGEELQINREQNKQRLIELFKQMKNNEALHAWGDESVCRFCNFSGLCRKAEWSED
jgi:ATP-dependent helicase/nuclease subunit B